MYVAILSGALDEWSDDLTGDALVAYVAACRYELSATARQPKVSAYARLAAEISYDRALVTLCRTKGIGVDITAFAHPRAERMRVELELEAAGIDLASMTTHPRRRRMQPGRGTRSQITAGR